MDSSYEMHLFQKTRKNMRGDKFTLKKYETFCNFMYNYWSDNLTNMSMLCDNLKLVKHFMKDPGLEPTNFNERIISRILIKPCHPNRVEYTRCISFLWKLLLSHPFCISVKLSITCVHKLIDYANNAYNDVYINVINSTNDKTNNSNNIIMLTNKNTIEFQ